MKIEEIEVANLKPYKLNAKKHPESQIEGIKNSMFRFRFRFRFRFGFGFTQPIVVDKDNEIIIGHGFSPRLSELGERLQICV